MSPKLISIVRSPHDLVALISRRVSDGDDPGFETVRVPLDQVKQSLYAAKGRLLESWGRLGEVTAANEHTLYDLSVVLLETVPALSSEKPADPLPAEWSAVSTPVRPTQAHPRAFRGTKAQPPKPGRLPKTDLRPYLCDARSLKAVLAPLSKFDVRRKLEKAGYSKSAIDAFASETPWKFPATFVQEIWPALRQESSRDIARTVTLCAELSDVPNENSEWEGGGACPTRAAFARLAAVAGGKSACPWGRIGTSLLPDRRSAFLETLIESGAYELRPDATIGVNVHEASSLASDARFRDWLRCLLSRAQSQLPMDYLMAGFRLAAQFYPNYRFAGEERGTCLAFPERDIEEIGIALQDDWLVMRLWSACGEFSGFSDVIRRSKWRSWSPRAAESYFHLLSRSTNSPSRRPKDRMWTVVSQWIPQIETHILAIPAEYQQKFVDSLSDWLDGCDTAAQLRKVLPSGLPILRHLSREPFETRACAEQLLLSFLQTEDLHDRETLLSAPDASFQALEAACRRNTDAFLITRGLEQLIGLNSSFAAQSFVAEPARLCRTAKALGSVNHAIRPQLLTECFQHPLFRVDPAATPLRELCALVIEHCTGGIDNPIPARLRPWLRGEIELSESRLERYQNVITEKFVLTRLSLIHQSVVQWIRRGLPTPPPTKPAEHALLVLASIRENRRGLRKFLDAYWSGNLDYLAHHPATLQWYRKHPIVPRKLWEDGIPFTSAPFVFQVEHDPLEILKMGTYVGSCLAIGGMFTDSAAAAVLDANKRVLYARDRQKRVIARQLVAISNEDRLVCFSVYPHSASKEIKTLFRDYDRAFASALGIPLYEPVEGDGGYEVDTVLSVYWWDDCSWDFQIPD